jgi:hypothetical protein
LIEAAKTEGFHTLDPAKEKVEPVEDAVEPTNESE